MFYLYVATSLVNKDDYIIYYGYASVQSVISLRCRCFRFVYIYTAVFCVTIPFLGE